MAENFDKLRKQMTPENQEKAKQKTLELKNDFGGKSERTPYQEKAERDV